MTAYQHKEMKAQTQCDHYLRLLIGFLKQLSELLTFIA